MDISDVLSRLENIKPMGSNKYQANCPIHDDQHASLSVTSANGKILIHCHAGCDTKNILDSIGLSWKDLHEDNQTIKRVNMTETVKTKKEEKKRDDRIYNIDEIVSRTGYVRHYEYCSSNGEIKYLAVRINKTDGSKMFVIYRRVGDNQFSYGLGDLKPIPYRLKELINAVRVGETVYIVEGEKDVETLVSKGFVATTNPFGAGKWKNEFSEYFTSANVVIIPDNDQVGMDHAKSVFASMATKVNSAKIVELPGLELKQDTTDWFEQGNTLDRFNEVVARTEGLRCGSVVKINFEYDKGACNDMYNAQLVVKQHGDSIRFCPEFKRYYVWDGKRWVDDKNKAEYAIKEKIMFSMKRLAENVEVLKLNNIDEEEISRYQTWVNTSLSNFRINCLFEMLGLFSELHTHYEKWDCQPDLFNCQNGTLNLKTLEFYPHNREDHLTQMSNVSYNPSSFAENWTVFLIKILEDSKDLHDYIQTLIGYSLTGHTSEKLFAILYGIGSNGKTTFLNTILDIMGEYAKTADVSSFLEKKNDSRIRSDIADLEGARFVQTSEAPDFCKLDTAYVKKLTGMNNITVSRKYENEFTYRPVFKLFIETNHKPTVDASDYAIWERIKMLPFVVTIPEEKRDKNLPEKLLSERSAIFNWMVCGAQNWYKNGFPKSESVMAATNEYRDDMNILMDFINENCDVAPGFFVPVLDLYQSYLEYAIANEEKPMQKRTFLKKIEGHGFPKKRGSGNKLMISGIALKTKEEVEDNNKKYEELKRRNYYEVI